MDLILYTASVNGKNNQVESLLNLLSMNEKPIICRTIDDLRVALRSPSSDVLAIVLIVSDEHDCRGILNSRERLLDYPIIIVLEDPEMNRRALHDLRPRFMTSLEDDITEVAAVLEKIRSRIGGFEKLKKGLRPWRHSNGNDLCER